MNSVFVEVLKRIFKKAKIRTLLMLVMLLSFNSVAWFIYATKVDSGISAKIVAWNVSFVSGEEELLQNINFKIDRIYPGMEEYSKRIDVSNSGDNTARLGYELVNARLLDEYYEVGGSISSSDLLKSLREDYPFKIMIGVSAAEVTPGSNAYFYVSVSWPFESGDDDADTLWGNRAYDYQKNNSDSESIEINLKISAVQQKN